jgi:hypothetical protein
VAHVQRHLVASAAAASALALEPLKYEVLVGGDAQLRMDTLHATLEDFHRCVPLSGSWAEPNFW